MSNRAACNFMAIGIGALVAGEMVKPDESCPLQCFNGGKCDNHHVTNEFYCDCPLVESGGFMGVHCETSFLECTDGERRAWRCLNGGMCKTGDTAEVCHCLSEFVGPTCAIFTGPSDSGLMINEGVVDYNQFSGTAIFIIALASVMLSFACFLSGFLVGRGKEASVKFADNFDEQSEASIAQLELNNNMESEHVNAQEDNDEPPELSKDVEIT